jgi:CheY-like chemotaxis protein
VGQVTFALSPYLQRKPLARKILLADDSVTAQNMGRKILADAGYEVVTVNNGSAALKKIAEIKPDLIILDVYMPGYSGLEVCQRLKEAGDTARIPVLLTVGKLEPFKPEEARRVRAEGFIVKPFEASELLGALAKLEDKIVPRADSSKPGRFARAIAAVEQGRFDKTVAIDEDSGWKNRIAFPSKKQGKSIEPDDGNDPALYNPVKSKSNPPAPASLAMKAEEHVDLAALAPEGLPKDVTAEEIAALAAAAAQVKGIAEGQTPEHPAAQPTAAAPSEIHQDEPREAAQPTPEAKTEAQVEPVQPPSAPESTLESKPESPQVADPATEGLHEDRPASLDAATFAAQKPEEHPAEKIEEGPKIPAAQEVPSVSNVAGLTDITSSSATTASLPVISESVSISHEPARQLEPEPVTMAVAAGHGEAPSRWTAVAVALAPDEAGMVLEDEMRQAYAAFVGASIGASESPREVSEIPAANAPAPETSKSETVPAIAELSVRSPLVSPVADDAAAAAPTSSSPEPTPALETPSPAAETLPASGQECEVVTPSHLEHTASMPAEPQISEPTAEAVPPVAETPVPAEQHFADKPTEEIPAPVSEPPVEAVSQAPSISETTQEPEVEAQKIDVPQEAEQQPAPQAARVEETPACSAEETKQEVKVVEPTAMESAAVIVDTHPVPDAPVSQEAAEVAAVSVATPGGTADMAKKESEVAAHTAAAWASWRRIRETGDSKSAPVPPAPEQKREEPAPAPRDEAALAVAAGAEKAPEEVPVTSEISPEIASIVDSVLADLRPRIVEEISRQLGKKK